MADEATTGACLRDYEEQLNTLDSNDIRVHNQSLILDYFCTDHELTDFLRDEVFPESSTRHNTWRKVNQRAGNESKRIDEDEISLLLDSGNNFSSRVWADIVRLTASRQAHQEIAESINRATNYGRPIEAGHEQWSLEPVREPKAGASTRNREKTNNKSSEQILYNANSHSQIEQPNRNSESTHIADNRLPLLIGSLALLGGMLGLAVSVGNNEPKALQPTGSGNSAKCTGSDQAELTSIVTELNSTIALADPRRMTGGTWQSVLSAYDTGAANLGGSDILGEYIKNARKAKALEASGCTYP